MATFRVQLAGLDQLKAEHRDINSNQLPFATALAITKTAQDAQGVIRNTLLPSRFTLRRSAWMKANIKIQAATKTKLEGTVTDTFSAMVLQETGGDKTPYGTAIAVPLEGARPRPSALIDEQNRPAAVMARGGFIRNGIMYAVTFKAGRRGRVSKSIVGIQQAATWSRKIVPMYALVPRARIKPIYNMATTVADTVKKNFAGNFEIAFLRAVRTAKR